jgi:large subunit ribosomal protein L25
MKRATLTADNRTLMGRKTGRLRRDGILPANIYGNDIESCSVQVNAKEFMKVFAETGETGLIDLMVDGTKRPVLVHDISYDPVTSSLVHIDFHQVNLKVEVTANVPVELTGESPAEKQGLGTVVQVVSEIEVQTLPDNIPSAFTLDISNLTEVDQQITLADLDYDKEHVKIDVENPEEFVIAKVDALTQEEVVETPVAEGTEGAPVEGTTETSSEGTEASE